MSRLVGYASVYGQPYRLPAAEHGGAVERIRPGAADAFLGCNPALVLNVNHDDTRTIATTWGETLRWGSDSVGVWFDGDCNDRRIVEQVRAGEMAAASIKFTPSRVAWTVENGERVRNVEQFNSLSDLCICPTGRNPRAAVRVATATESRAAVLASIRSRWSSTRFPTPTIEQRAAAARERLASIRR